jgi:hypothetical protein
MSKKIGIIIPYFGKRPSYMDHFLAGCGFNTSIDWLFITDIEQIPDITENIQIIKSDLNSFSKLATLKLGFPVEIRNPYKLCDYKPAFGLIFEDWLEKYQYWGYCDVDVIPGKIDHFLPFTKISDYDIISTYKGFLSGPFCLFRNTENLKRLFTFHPDYKSLLQDPDYLGFDENIQRSAISGFSLQKILYLISFIIHSRCGLNIKSFSFREFRYQFQWYVKRNTINEQSPSDVTEIAFLKHRMGEIKVFSDELVFSDSYFKRLNKKSWRLGWKDGILTDMDNSKQIFGFHFRETKNSPEFRIEKFDGEFIITEKGIFNNS